MWCELWMRFLVSPPKSQYLFQCRTMDCGYVLPSSWFSYDKKKNFTHRVLLYIHVFITKHWHKPIQTNNYIYNQGNKYIPPKDKKNCIDKIVYKQSFRFFFCFCSFFPIVIDGNNKCIKPMEKTKIPKFKFWVRVRVQFLRIMLFFIFINVSLRDWILHYGLHLHFFFLHSYYFLRQDF